MSILGELPWVAFIMLQRFGTTLWHYGMAVGLSENSKSGCKSCIIAHHHNMNIIYRVTIRKTKRGLTELKDTQSSAENTGQQMCGRRWSWSFWERMTEAGAGDRFLCWLVDKRVQTQSTKFGNKWSSAAAHQSQPDHPASQMFQMFHVLLLLFNMIKCHIFSESYEQQFSVSQLFQLFFFIFFG